LVISNGVIVADGKPENLAAAMSGERELIVRVAGPRDGVRQLLKSQDGIRDARPIGEIEAGSHDFLIESLPNADIRKPMFAALAKAGYPILMLRPQDATLEQIFLKLTANGDGRDALQHTHETPREESK
jgi:ABC-2 type transport system ATP-binding protein